MNGAPESLGDLTSSVSKCPFERDDLVLTPSVEPGRSMSSCSRRAIVRRSGARRGAGSFHWSEGHSLRSSTADLPERSRDDVRAEVIAAALHVDLFRILSLA